ncbi:LysR family transcriptional regulator [Paraburkholderia susongensis]|uniref:Transcriptional regulator, LysR family n=1 Tax=Paraburkholderia susongensis TaxID=1515439 RepID=A0A1X7J153_9BURK|nr:LysR family transcriptional regulator [Paraburkholderia susongensis]SMG21055.1 transcriptional regulator, LysR family [Paraburkholderia susongensis]
MINLFQAMQAFVKVADAGSFAQAAAQLGVSTSVVTRHVSSLEQHLGIRLFQRTTRKVVLTEAGAQYADGCRVLLAELEEVESRATTASKEVAGDLRIVALGSFSLFRLTPLFAEYQARFPQVNLRVTLTEKRVDLLDGGFDVGIVTEHMIRSESLVVRRLINSHAVPVAAAAYLARAGHPQTPADLARHQLIAAPFDTSGPMWILRNGAAREGDGQDEQGKEDEGSESIAVDASFTVNSMIMQKQAALGAMGIALLPLEMVADELRAGTLVRVLDGYTVLNGDVAVSLVYPSREFVPRKVREFIDLAVGYFE